METAAPTFRTYLGQCGNGVVEHENKDEFLTAVFYDLLNRQTCFKHPLYDRIQDMLASYLTQAGQTNLNDIPANAFLIPPSIDFKHGRYIQMDGLYHAYLMILADGYRTHVTAGWMSLLVNAGEDIDRVSELLKLILSQDMDVQLPAGGCLSFCPSVVPA